MEIQNVTDTLENSWQFLTKQNVFLSYDPGIGVLGTYPKELKTYELTVTQKSTCRCL